MDLVIMTMKKIHRLLDGSCLVLLLVACNNVAMNSTCLPQPGQYSLEAMSLPDAGTMRCDDTWDEFIGPGPKKIEPDIPWILELTIQGTEASKLTRIRSTTPIPIELTSIKSTPDGDCFAFTGSPKGATNPPIGCTYLDQTINFRGTPQDGVYEVTLTGGGANCPQSSCTRSWRVTNWQKK